MINLADIAGANAVVQLSATSISARTVNFFVTGSGTVRVGDASVTSTRGYPVLAAQPLALAWAGDDYIYQLSQLNAFIPSGTTLSVAYEPFG